VGWLNVNDDKGFLDAELLWQGGSVVPVASVYFVDNTTLAVTRTREISRAEETQTCGNPKPSSLNGKATSWKAQ
jgi:hypothetical protein